MIFGATYWNDRSRMIDQGLNPSEEVIRKERGRPRLETCGPSASFHCMSARGTNTSISCPGIYKPRPPEVLMDYFQDSGTHAALKRIRPDLNPSLIFSNRIPNFYARAVKDVFNADASYYEIMRPAVAIQGLRAGYTFQMLLKSPSHFIAIVAYDDVTSEFLYWDSNPGRTGTDGFNLRFQESAFDLLLHPHATMYHEG